MSQLPQPIEALTGGQPYRRDNMGMSGAEIRIYPDAVLKITPADAEAAHEAAALRWLAGRLPVPRVLACLCQNERQYLLMSRLPGAMSCSRTLLAAPDAVAAQLARALRALWAVPVDDCPLDATLTNKLQQARYNVEHGLVDVDAVEPTTFGPGGFADPWDLLRWLEQNRPPEDLVFTHGDLSLPNVFLQGEAVAGFLDLGKAGVADRYVDLAICTRSLRHNTDGGYGFRVEGFDPMRLFAHLGFEPDAEKLRYYTLLDELF